MKKAITILSICLLTIAGTQTTQAQTKEETIAWIKEKLEKYGGGDGKYERKYFTNVQVSPCSVSWRGKNSDSEYSDMSFNPSTVRSWSIDIDKTVLIPDSDAITYRSYDGGENYANGMGAFLQLRNGEANIHERMIKALLHLATFCEQGKGEAF